jgi:DNA polymerase-3 subunit alpha
MGDGANLVIAGLVSAITRRTTRKGELMLFFNLEDLEGSVEVLCYPRTVAEAGQLVQDDAILVVEGRLDHRGEDIKVIARSLRELAIRTDDSLRLEVPVKRMSADIVSRLKGILINHPGTAPVMLHMVNGPSHKVLRLSDEFRVELRSALYAELRELLGPRAVG